MPPGHPARTLELARALSDQLISLRRELHQIPELGLDLPLTQRRLLMALEGLDLEITLGESLSSITAVLRGGGGPGPVVLLRGDMDALPVTERLDLPYASTHPGQMHACGHDLHMAGLVGAATVLHAMRGELAGDVVFMFQPGEEDPGGAEPMIAEGLLEVAGRRVDSAFALHVQSSGDPLGVWCSRPGPVMAACDEVTVRVIGAGGHGSQPHRALDPIPAACEMVMALQTMVTRSFDAFDPIVVTVGKIAGGTKENIIPDDATFEATVRTFSAANRERAGELIPRLAQGIAAAHGLAVDVDYHQGYPATVNDAAEYDAAVAAITDLFGAPRYRTMPNPEAGGEDFAYVQHEVPGCYVYISACPDAADPATAPDNHSARAHFDDSVLPDCAALLAELAVRRLSRPAAS